MKGVSFENVLEPFNSLRHDGKLQLGVDRCDYCGQVLLS